MRKIYEAIYGIHGSSINPARSVLYGGEPTSTFPKVTVNGEPIYPEFHDATPVSGGGAATPVGQTPSGSSTAGVVLVPVAAGWLVKKRSRPRRRSRSSGVIRR